jgi:oligopeptide transport system ATP-binding protein
MPRRHEYADIAALIEIDALSVQYDGRGRPTRHAVREFSLSLNSGEIVAVIGESGSGKSQIVLALLRLLGTDARVGGSVRFGGRELMTLPAAAMNRIRGAEIAMIFQDPASALNPYLDVGTQLGEVMVTHRGATWREARTASVTMLERVRMADPLRRLSQYPHELSGGMRQRVMIAMSLLCAPRLLIADEPTTALDSTVQGQIMELLRELHAELQMAVIFISHDLALAFGFAHRVAVMYGGRVVETAPAADLFAHPLHPYTQALLAGTVPSDPLDRLPSLPGQPPDASAVEAGCAFAPRCPCVQPVCRSVRPPLEVKFGRYCAACHFPS